ncbi:hypothetical protein RRG08_051976 [Elysia crispata]|uniref:Major facilitator superfamily (MFS) profile domain-containing protein n=1 Tax=Elysia crispata TaxID=231223 RepID=A0AAE1DDU0_9GAST|nr:hypothetical protein RRG08_051976 [Elysia crispata]
MRYDDILEEVGQIGPYQRRVFILLCVPLAIVAATIMSTVFILTEPVFRCAVPDLDSDTYTIKDEYHRALVDAAMGSGRDCNVYSEFNISDPFFGNGSQATEKCHRWVYDKTNFTSSIITEFNLVCDKTYVRASSNAGMFAGSFVGCFAFGVLADIIGRKRSILICLVWNTVCCVLLFFMPTIVSVIIVRVIHGMSFQVFGIAFSTSMELVGPDWRTTMGMGADFAWVAGEFLVLPLAYFANEWRRMYLAIGIASLLALLAVSLTPESPRWLLDKGKHMEAKVVIEKIAASNNRTLPEGAITKDTGEDGPSVKVWEMFKYRHLVIRTLIIFYNWFCVNLIYSGLSLNLDNLPGNPFINFLIGCSVELVAYVLTFLVLDRLGRKRVHTAAMLFGGIACLLVIVPVTYLPSENSWVVTALAMLGKTAAAICYATLYIMTSELFPTVVRSSGLACCSIFENIAATSSPYIADLGKLVGGNLSQALPMMVMGSCALLAGLLSTQLPETLGRDLPETVQDALNYDRNSKQSEEDERAQDMSKEIQLDKM